MEITNTEQLRIVSDKVTDGLGYGQGEISYAERLAEVGRDKLAAAEKIINSTELLVKIGPDEGNLIVDDDGCGDGRGVSRVFQGTVEKETISPS